VSIIYSARALLALLQPLTGKRAMGTVTVRSTGATGLVDHSQHGIPVVNGSIQPALLFKTSRNPARTDGAWPVERAGTSVPILSVLGGLPHNLDEGTELRWLPTPEGIEATARVDSGGLSGGAPNDSYTGVAGIRFFDEIPNTQQAAVEAFRSALPGFPGLVLAWDSQERDDGMSGTPLGEGPSRLGRGQKLMRDTWNLFLLVSRMDSDPARRQQGLAILDEISETIADRYKADEMIVSTARGLSIHRLARGYMGPQFYVYLCQFSTAAVLRKRELREFSPWLHTRVDAHTTDSTPFDTVVNNLVNMPQ
jgi:hypothetical protein